MIIKRLRLVNFCQYHKLSYEHSFGITGIVGQNGGGKTNFMDAGHRFALTGATLPSTSKSGLVNWDSATGQTLLDFQHDGIDYLLVRNLHNSGVTLTWDDSAAGEAPSKKKITGNKNVTPLIEDMLGVTMDVFLETCFVSQADMVRIITMTHSDRMQYFQRLADVRKAEVLRGVLQAGVLALPAAMDRTPDIAEDETRVRHLKMDIEVDTRSADKLEEELDAEEDEVVRNKVRMRLPTSEEADARRYRLQERLNKARLVLKDVEKRVQELPEEPPEITVEMRDLYTAWTHREELQGKQEELEEDLYALNIPDEPVHPQPAIDRVEQLKTMYADMRPKYILARDGICPTCRRPYETEGEQMSAEEAAELIKQYELLGKKLEAESRALRSALEYYKQLTRTRDKAVADKERLEADIAEVAEEIENMSHTVDGLDDFDEVEYCDLVRRTGRYNEALRARESMLPVVQGAKDDVLAIEAEIKQEESNEQLISKEEQCKAAEFVEEHNDKRKTLLAIREEIASNKSAVSVTEQRIVKMRAEVAKYCRIFETRALFERCREILHRDNLPKIVMRRMLKGLNEYLDKYLQAFNADFTAYLDDEFDLLCAFKHHSDIPAAVLSGGQKVALSIAFHFAKAEMLGASTRFLVMDEPTIWLDDRSKECVVEVLRKAGECAKHGMTVLVATHDDCLLPSFQRVFDPTACN